MFSSRTQLFAASLLRDVKQRARKYGRKTLDFVRARAQIIVIFGALERETAAAKSWLFSTQVRNTKNVCSWVYDVSTTARTFCSFFVFVAARRQPEQKEKPSLLVVLAPRLFTFN